MSEKNTAELARLIHAHLAEEGIGPVEFTMLLPEKKRRAFYNWIDGAVPRNDARLPLEDALGWKRGAVTKVLESPFTKKFTLAELRDWEQVKEGPATSAADLSVDELLVELTRRVGKMKSEIRMLREGSSAPQDVYRLAASRRGEGRNMEHLEADE